MKWIAVYFLTAFFWINPTPVQAMVNIPFDGNIDFVNGKLTATIKNDEQDIDINIARTSPYVYESSVRLQPLMVNSVQLKSDIDIHVKQEVVNEDLSATHLGIQSRYTLLNGKPLRDLVGELEWREDKLFINLLELGGFSINGIVTPQSPKPLDVVIKWEGIELEPSLNMTRPTEKHVVAEGLASGQVRLIGPWHRPRMQGAISTYNGFIDDFVFNSINFRFEGHYPNIDITEAILNRPGEVTGNLTGEINLSNLATFITQFKALKKEPIINHQDEHEVGWVYRRVTAENDLGKSVSESQYFIRKDDWVNQDESEHGGMLGVERRFDF